MDPRSLVPLDFDLILKSARKTRHVVMVQEAVRRGVFLCFPTSLRSFSASL